MSSTYQLFLIQALLLLESSTASDRSYPKLEPTPNFTEAVCYKDTQCPVRFVQVKIYIEDELYEKVVEFREEGNITMDIKDMIRQRLDDMFLNINKHLLNLDNGGYNAEYDGTFHLINSSDLTLGKTYIDRKDENKTKEFNKWDVWSWTFAFQEAVEKLDEEERFSVDVRILLRFYPGLTSTSTAEENCIGDHSWERGCIMVFSVDPWEWFRVALFVHEFGHALGCAAHDDETYEDYDNKLIMSSRVGRNAKIWSPRAKKLIRDQGDKYHNKLRKEFPKILPQSDESEVSEKDSEILMLL